MLILGALFKTHTSIWCHDSSCLLPGGSCFFQESVGKGVGKGVVKQGNLHIDFLGYLHVALSLWQVSHRSSPHSLLPSL